MPLIIPRKNFRFERLKGLISYPLFIFNSKNVDREKRRYRKLVNRLFKIKGGSEKTEEHNRRRDKAGERGLRYEGFALLCIRTS